MSRLAGRIAIVTGAGRGLGRAHALFLAAQKASVVVNDLGGDVHGSGSDETAAEAVVAEIVAAGGEAVASHHDVSDWDQAEAMVDLARETFGGLHVLVNNAGILRDRTLAKMSEAEWDAVLAVHLKGHAAPTRHAMAYWAAEAKAGRAVKASTIHTTSVAGFAGNFGQANYSAAKAGIMALSRVVAVEGARYGVRSNALSPSARTRITLDVPGAEDRLSAKGEDFDRFAPENVSPLVGWLAEADCPANGQTFHVDSNRILVIDVAAVSSTLYAPGRWTLDLLDEALPPRLVEPTPVDRYLL